MIPVCPPFAIRGITTPARKQRCDEGLHRDGCDCDKLATRAQSQLSIFER
jgi:hypothetical protein